MIVLDTHALVWWASNPERLGTKARRSIEKTVNSGEQLGVSSISAWEIALLVRDRRLDLSMDAESWLAHVEATGLVEFMPVDNRVSLRAVHLDDFAHRDPADRIIVATAVGLGASLVTADSRIRSYRGVRTIWD